MSHASLSAFLTASANYLGLDVHHGDTETTHPYVPCEMIRVSIEATCPAVVVAPSPRTVFPAPAPAVAAPISWAAQWSLGKFGRMTPGGA